MSDEDLSRALTSRVRSIRGVTGVHPPRPIAHAAAEVVAATLALREPDVLVALERDGAALRITTGIAVDDGRPAPDTVREVGEQIRDLVDADPDTRADLISVTIRLVEGVSAPDPA